MSLRLDLLEIDSCDLDIQRFVNAVGKHDNGPRKVGLQYCRLNGNFPEVSFTSVIVPLLQNKGF
jgi:hypothetical protein